jgi:hypothetical protein
VKELTTLVVAFGVTLWLPVVPAQSAEESAKSAEKPATTPKCLEAAVNPVTGYAVCVNPVGAPVEAPPASSFNPCKSRPHDNEAWTTYEHWSGCQE